MRVGGFGLLTAELQMLRGEFDGLGDVHTRLVTEQENAVGEFAEPMRPVRPGPKRSPAALGAVRHGGRQRAQQRLQFEQQRLRGGMQVGDVRGQRDAGLQPLVSGSIAGLAHA